MFCEISRGEAAPTCDPAPELCVCVSHIHRSLMVVVQVDLVGVTVVEEPPEGELEEAVEGLAVVQLAVRLVGVGTGVPQLVGVYGVEVGGVRGVVYPGYVGRRLPPQTLLEVDALEEGMVFDFVGVLAQPGLLAGAQL